MAKVHDPLPNTQESCSEDSDTPDDNSDKENNSDMYCIVKLHVCTSLNAQQSTKLMYYIVQTTIFT